MDRKGEVNVADVLGIIIAVAISLLIASALMPAVMDNFYDTSDETPCWGTRPEGVYDNVTCNTSYTPAVWGYWNVSGSEWINVTSGEATAVTSIWWIVPILVIVAILMIFIMIVRKQL